MPRQKHESGTALLDDLDAAPAEAIEQHQAEQATEPTIASELADPYRRESGCMPHDLEAEFLRLKFGDDPEAGMRQFAQAVEAVGKKIDTYAGYALSIETLCRAVHWRRVLLRRWSVVAALAGRLDEVPTFESSPGVEAWTLTLQGHGQKGLDEYRKAAGTIEEDARAQVARGLGALPDYWPAEFGHFEHDPRDRRDNPRKAFDRMQRIAEARRAIEAIEEDRALAPDIRRHRLGQVFEEHGGSEPLAVKVYTVRLLAGIDPQGQEAAPRLRGLAAELATVSAHLAEVNDPLSTVPEWMAQRSRDRHAELTAEIAAERAKVDKLRRRSAEDLVMRAMAGDDAARAELIDLDRKGALSDRPGFGAALAKVDMEWQHTPRLVEMLTSGALPEPHEVDRTPWHLPWNPAPEIPGWWHPEDRTVRNA